MRKIAGNNLNKIVAEPINNASGAKSNNQSILPLFGKFKFAADKSLLPKSTLVVAPV